ncbi:MAG: 2TM domain-containing protein [Chitinophagaceae bacterium]
MQTPDNDKLWRIAKKRANFKKSAFAYVVVNIFLWTIYWITHGYEGFEFKASAWPIWVTLGWGIGIAFQYYEAYTGNQDDLVEREYEKLKQEKKDQSTSL